MFELLTFSCLIVIGTIASITDIREGKIYNIVNYPSILLGFLMWFAYLGVDGLVTSMIGFGIAAGIYMIIFFIGGFGAGDVKFAAVIGAFMGYPLVITWIVISAIVGGLLALILLVRFRLKKADRFRMKDAIYIPFGPPMALAILITYGYNFMVSSGLL
ncbi:MAG: A24 family peptidase [Myxococcota bacterium]